MRTSTRLRVLLPAYRFLGTHLTKLRCHRLVYATAILLAACGSDFGVPPSAPSTVDAFPGNGAVELSWDKEPGATEYTLLWSTSREGFPANQQIRNVSSPFVHSKLANFTTYYYAIVASNPHGTSPSSAIVSAEPGPAPAAAEWAVAITEGDENVVYWAEDPLADGYRVYWTDNHSALRLRTPNTSYEDIVAPPLRQPKSANGQVIYFRIDGRNGPRLGPGSVVAHTAAFERINVDVSPYVTPALWDIDGDGCFDAVGSRGRCDGTFEPTDFAGQGVDALMGPGRANRDSRFADFTGDGYVDIFTNVYSRADDAASYALLHVNQRDGTFFEDPSITNLKVRGYGETVLAADFNNDGAIDLFLPHYGHMNDGGRHWLLMNDGTGNFRDVAEAAGLIRNPTLYPLVPEAAQALDFNEDGFVDIFVASQLFINNGDMTFIDRSESINLPVRFDEGAKFVDIDLDGDLDLVHHDSVETRLYRNDGGVLDTGVVFNSGTRHPQTGDFGYGLNVCDVNDDGFEDIIVAKNTQGQVSGRPRLFLNVNGELRRSEFAEGFSQYNDLMVCADLNNDHAQDLLIRGNAFTTFLNQSKLKRTIAIRVLGRHGEQNQQGRLVRIKPLSAPDRVQTRFVEGGSGYMAQGGYDLIVAAPWHGTYEVSVRFPHGWVTVPTRAQRRAVIREDGTTTTFPSIPFR